MPNLKGCFVGGGLLTAVGIATFVISLALIPSVVKKVGEDAVADNVIVSSNKSSYYDNWIGDSSRTNYFLQYYYAYNLTNPAEVLAGGKANFSQIGPFNYKYEWDYLDVSFSDDGNHATYSQKKYYIFDNTTSAFPEDTMITGINPAWLGFTSTLIQQGVPATVFTAVLFFPTIPLILEQLNSKEAINFYYGFSGIGAFQNNLFVLLNSTGVDMATFYSNWANLTTAPQTGNWNGMLTSLNQANGSGILAESAEIIFNVSNPLSLLNTQGMITWYNAANGDATATTTLTTGINLTNAQLQIVIQWWYTTFANAITLNSILNTCGLSADQTSMIGFCQFYNGTILNGTSITSYNFNVNPFLNQPPPEVIGMTDMTQTEFYDICFNNAVDLASGAGGLAFLQGTMGLAPLPWNFTDGDLNAIGTAMGGQQGAANSISNTNFNALVQENGLFVTKTAYDWLWGCNDPILNFLSQPNPCGLQVNNTLLNPTTVHTGKDDNLLTNYLIQWQGYTELPFWGPPGVNATGYTESGQFAPNQGKMDTLTIFEENVFRPVQLNYFNDTEVHDIKTRRYYLQNNSFPANPETFYTSIDGFANLTSIQNASVFISLWDMWEVPENISSQVNGMNPTYENAAIPLDLEPISGNALYYNLKLQVNFLYVDNGWAGTTYPYFKNVGNNIYYPSWKIGQTATPSDDTLDNLKKQLKQLRELKIVPVIVMALVGSLMFVAGIVMLVITSIRYKRIGDYNPINEGNY